MYKFVKRLSDIIFSLAAIAVLSPLLVVITLVNLITLGCSPFYVHKRIGKNGKTIGILKFRSMVKDADKMIENFTPEQKKEWAENFKLKNDPRITPFGKILRVTSLDELPQLFNILKGDMSFVGPRPVVEKELKWYGSNRDKLLSVKPGLTGWWACNGRNCVKYPERCDLELYYVDHASLILDIKVIFKTAASVFSHRGAM